MAYDSPDSNRILPQISVMADASEQRLPKESGYERHVKDHGTEELWEKYLRERQD